ncbi:MAG: ABC transporter ATP-binding protein [Saprospiraceae bacterium]|nr:ABC transporter ATP-binding protein [Saprospiraceae bacterium]
MWYRLQHLNLSYEDQVILDDISLEVKEDEFIGVLGDSGSGKTQLSLAIGGLNRFYGAKISSQYNTFSYEGKESNLSDTIAAVEFRRLSIGYILQEAFSYFNPVLKIKQQLADKNFNSDDIKTLLPAIGLPDIDRILNSYPHQLSGGQLQRLAIVTCMAGSPQIIVADEIESALDAENASLVFDLCSNLKRKKNFH